MPITSFGSPSAIAKPGVIANAAARPASPYEGQAVYQVDTDALLIWNGSAWTPPWNTAWGTLGRVSLTSLNQTGITTITDITGASITFTAVANRLYKVWAHGYHNTSAANVTVNQVLREGSTTLQQSLASSVIATSGTFCQTIYVSTFSAGSHTLKVSCTLSSGTGTITAEGGSTYPYQFAVEDIGPA